VIAAAVHHAQHGTLGALVALGLIVLLAGVPAVAVLLGWGLGE
jgi:hypothetical protein